MFAQGPPSDVDRRSPIDRRRRGTSRARDCHARPLRPDPALSRDRVDDGAVDVEEHRVGHASSLTHAATDARRPNDRRHPRCPREPNQVSSAPSSSSVTSAAIAERSERISVTCPKRRWPLSVSMTDATPSWRPTRRLSRCADVVGEHDAGVLADAAEHRQQHVALERLRLVDDHERVVQRPAADVGERQHLEEAALDDLFEHVGRDDRPERVEDRLTPGVHLLALVAGQVAELLAADREQRPEHDDLRCCWRSSTASSPAHSASADLPVPARPPSETMPTSGSSSRSIAMPLLGRAAVQAEDLAVAAHQPELAVAGHAAERRAALGVDDEPGVDGQPAHVVAGRDLALVEVADVVARDVERRRCRSSPSRRPARRGTPRRLMPSEAAFTRIGRSFETTVTS